jgi:hypothetical protein
MTIQIKCVLVEWKAMEMGQYGEAYCVTFRVGTDPHTLTSQFGFLKRRRKKI